MNDYTPKVGHRVRVIHTLEGVLTDVADERYFNIREDGRTRETYMSLIGGSVSVERLPDPEPEWQPGDVVIGSEGTVLLRTVQSKWVSTSGYFYRGDSDLDIARPLTHLVRNGKPVQS